MFFVTDIRPINDGTFATTYAAILKTKREKYNIVIKRSYALRQSWAELEALKKFGLEQTHQNFVRYYGNIIFGSRMYLFLEFAPFGDLSQYLSLKYQDRDPTEEEIFRIFRHVGNGLIYMHMNGYAHRDLKFHNILVFEGDSDSGYVNQIICKLCDFGSSRGDLRLPDGSIKLLSTVIGTPKLMAPEISGGQYDAFIADTYSLGVILYQLSHSGQYLFDLGQNYSQDNTSRCRRQEVQELVALKRRPENIKFSSSISDELKELLQRMLEPEPHKRIHLKHISSTDWMKRYLNS